MRIYIAGPYSAHSETERVINTYKAIDAGVEVYRKGHIPYIPHLYHWVDKRHKNKLGWADYMHIGTEWLEQCDAILYLGSSKGADIELELAKDLGLKVFRLKDFDINLFRSDRG